MRMTEWAEKEVEIAKARERGNAPENEWDYGCACYDSALKAFKCLMEDGHSGFSISITKHILNRLIDGQALTPIEDTEDIWSDIVDRRKDGSVHYQCKRMTSLFKIVYHDGTIEYKDVDRIYCVDFDNPNISYHSGLVSGIINEMYPIEMPYVSNGHYKVTCHDFLVDPKNGDFDTVGVFNVVTPDGENVEIARFFKASDTGWDEISEEEYYERQYQSIKR